MAPFGPAQGTTYRVTQVPRDIEQNVLGDTGKEFIARDLQEARGGCQCYKGQRGGRRHSKI